MNFKSDESFIYIKKYISENSKFEIINISFNEKQGWEYYRYWPTIKQKPLKDWNYNFENFLSYEKTKVDDKFFKNYRLINKNRLITTDIIIVLPTSVNIMVVTNSFDVVHSWFVPGIGIKFDCVPGRSTHHHLYFEQPGLYYGQCAEVCGRSHHHMPIKLMVLKIESYIIWWYYNISRNFIEFVDEKDIDDEKFTSFVF